jgi:tRNA uridine 5-carbamoylmethylation protein Kti12
VSFDVAKTLEDAYNALEFKPTTDGFFTNYYVERKEVQINELATQITYLRRSAKILFSGHRGSGKTTELHNVAEKLENKGFFVVFVAATDNLHLGDVHYADIFLVMVKNTYQKVLQSSIELNKSTRDDLESILRKLTAGSLSRSKDKIVAYMDEIFNIKGHLSFDVQVREQHRKIINESISNGQLIKIFNEIVSSVVSTTHKKMIIIMDDLEKVTNYDKILELLDKYHAYIDNLDCSIVLTIPPSLMTDPAFSQLSRAYNRYFLPLFQVRDKYGNENTEQIRLMQEIIKKRIADNLIHSEVIRLAALRSGGLITDFIRMLKVSFVKALSHDMKSVNHDLLDESFEEIIENYDLILSKDYYGKLVEVHRSKNIINDEMTRAMINYDFILMYGNSEGIWYDIHPAIETLLSNRGQLQDRWI